MMQDYNIAMYAQIPTSTQSDIEDCGAYQQDRSERSTIIHLLSSCYRIPTKPLTAASKSGSDDAKVSNIPFVQGVSGSTTSIGASDGSLSGVMLHANLRQELTLL